MKVKIGEYTSRLTCDIHSNHMNKKYGYVDWPKVQDRKDDVLESIEDAVQSVYNVFNWIWYDRRTQKVKVRIDRWDTWSMDHTLGRIVLPMLKQLKESNHGSPLVDDEDVPEELKSTTAPAKENEGHHQREIRLYGRPRDQSHLRRGLHWQNRTCRSCRGGFRS